MKSKLISLTFIAFLTAFIFSGCGDKTGSVKKIKLDPNNPVSLSVWHYYNGAQQAAFDELVSEFNATVGSEMGIYVEGTSKGSVNDLEKAVTDAVNGVIGSGEMPSIFSSYSDTAYYLFQKDALANLSPYFSEDELSLYVDSYINEGYIVGDDNLYLFPVAKSTEIMMINKTRWDEFAKNTGATYDDLQTIEGVTKVAKLYYEWTDSLTPEIENDGKAFYGRDSMSNYFIIGMKQLGTEIFEVNDNKLTLNLNKDQIKILWDNYYVPYVNGYFASLGKFRSDDVKTGDIIAYTGSSSSSMYFPDYVEESDKREQIDYDILSIPVFEGAEKVNVQQGAGMAVAKSDDQHEYAACVFLKWFTEKDNNLRFVCDSAYLPVRKEAHSVEALDKVIADNNITINSKAYDCLTKVMADYENNTFYTPGCFENGYSIRSVLDYNLSDKAAEDKASIDAMVLEGKDKDEITGLYTSDEAFEDWYNAFCNKLTGMAK